MKKILAMLLALTMLLAASALAEELPYIRQMPQYTYVLARVLTAESYPEVCLMSGYAYQAFRADTNETLFVCFPGPAGAQVESFSSYTVHYLDTDNCIQYTYIANPKDSYEEFMNEASADEYILLDGSDSMAAYIDPDRCNAYGMIGINEMGKSAKLEIRISMDNLDTKMPLEDRVTALTDIILPEVARVKEQMRFETQSPFWSAGKFGGAKLLDEEFQTIFRLDFPQLEVTFDDGAKQADLVVTDVDYNRIEGIYCFQPGLYITLRAEFDDYAYPISKFEDEDPAAYQATLSDGSQWTFWTNNMDDGSIISLYAAKAIEGVEDRSGRPIYLCLQMQPNGYRWNSQEECVAMVEAFLPCIQAVPVEQDPYVAPEAPAEAEEPAQAEAPAEEPAEAEGTEG